LNWNLISFRFSLFGFGFFLGWFLSSKVSSSDSQAWNIPLIIIFQFYAKIFEFIDKVAFEHLMNFASIVCYTFIKFESYRQNSSTERGLHLQQVLQALEEWKSMTITPALPTPPILSSSSTESSESKSNPIPSVVATIALPKISQAASLMVC
jgi:hypothetical protein